MTGTEVAQKWVEWAAAQNVQATENGAASLPPDKVSEAAADIAALDVDGLEVFVKTWVDLMSPTGKLRDAKSQAVAFNIALAKQAAFNDAMKRLHEARQERAKPSP